jgi:hypothetical protein
MKWTGTNVHAIRKTTVHTIRPLGSSKMQYVYDYHAIVQEEMQKALLVAAQRSAGLCTCSCIHVCEGEKTRSLGQTMQRHNDIYTLTNNDSTLTNNDSTLTNNDSTLTNNDSYTLKNVQLLSAIYICIHTHTILHTPADGWKNGTKCTTTMALLKNGHARLGSACACPAPWQRFVCVWWSTRVAQHACVVASRACVCVCVRWYSLRLMCRWPLHVVTISREEKPQAYWFIWR